MSSGYKSRKDKVELIKGLLSGKMNLSESLPPLVQIVHTSVREPNKYYDEEGRLLSEAYRSEVEIKAKPRATIWISVVAIDK